MGLDDDRGVTELVESFPGVFSSKAELHEEFVGQGGALVLMDPYGQGGSGCVIISRFANRAKRPIDLKGSEPSVRGLSNLRTGRGGPSYRW